MTLNVQPGFLWNDSTWNPSMISTALWLDAADSSTVTTVSSAVSQWNDKSGNARNCVQSSSGLRPAYESAAINGRNAIGFSISTASNQFLNGISTLPLPLSARSTFLVFQETTSVANAGVFSLVPASGSDTASTDGLGHGLFNPQAYYVLGSSGSNYSVFSDSTTRPTALGIYSEVANNSLGTAYVNGTAQATTDSSFTAFTSTSGQGYLVAARYQSSAISGAYLRGRIAEIIHVGSVVSTDTRQKIEGYLAHKWGLEANLPVGHPYKTTGPTP